MENTKERFERPGQPEPPVDYFLVVAHFEEWYVSREMAQAIEASLKIKLRSLTMGRPPSSARSSTREGKDGGDGSIGS